MRLQIAPLPLEFKLDELVAFDLVAQLVARALDGVGLAQRQISIPFRPRNVVVSFLERHEQGEFVEPAGVSFAESREGFALGRRTALKRPEGIVAARGVFQAITAPKSTWSAGKFRARSNCARIEIAALHQCVEADQERIAGEGGETLIRRVAVSGGPQRQNLPDTLPGIAQKVGEAMRLRSQFADAVRSRKRSWV